jgi:hypothetical protein
MLGSVSTVQSALPTRSVGPSESERHPLEQKPELPLTHKDDERLDHERLDDGRVQDIEGSFTNGEYMTNPVIGADVQIDTTTLAIQDQQILQVSPRNQADVLTIYDPGYTINQVKS